MDDLTIEQLNAIRALIAKKGKDNPLERLAEVALVILDLYLTAVITDKKEGKIT